MPKRKKSPITVIKQDGSRTTVKASSFRRFTYRDYRKSRHWKRTRHRRLEMDRFTCQHCKGKRGDPVLQVHHLTYERCPWHERLEDLITLCSKCHGYAH